MRLSLWLVLACVAASLGAGATAHARGDAVTWHRGVAVVGYSSEAALQRALERHPAEVVRRIPQLRAAVVRPSGGAAAFAAALRREPGIVDVSPVAPRVTRAEPGTTPVAGVAAEWQWAATHADGVPGDVLRAASAVTVAVVDTGADLAAPDLGAKAPTAWSVVRDSTDVSDANGHGTFVAALAAGSVTNGDGIAGFGGDASLLVVQASGADGSFTDVDEADAIVYAVDHGARVVNLSLGGADTSPTERAAIAYAVRHGVLLVAAAGNEGDDGNPIEYPAALLQPAGSNGVGGVGLSVAASTPSGGAAAFSSSGSWVSLAAPGVDVLSAVSSASAAAAYPRSPLAGSHAGLYGYGSGTSFAAPQVAGAAALVWAVQPSLTAQQVADILKGTASGGGTWNPQLGYGVLDVSAAVARAAGAPPTVQLSARRSGRVVELDWHGDGASAFRLTVSQDSGPQRVLAEGPTTSASYALLPGHVYSFTVAAVDGTGAPQAVSRPYEIAFRRAAATVELASVRANGQLVFTAVVRGAGGSAAPAGQALVLESFDRAGWHRVGDALTGAGGRARFAFPAAGGSYRVRARLLASDELAAAVSRPLTLRVTR